MLQQATAIKGNTPSSISLQIIINNLVKHSMPVAQHHNTQVVNGVHQGLVLASLPDKVLPVMKHLLHTIISNSSNGDIHITAGKFSDVVILEIQERNNNNGYALAYSIGSIESDATSLGGHITINGPRQKVVTISFSFPYRMSA